MKVPRGFDIRLVEENYTLITEGSTYLFMRHGLQSPRDDTLLLARHTYDK
jgi:hypothetical protein